MAVLSSDGCALAGRAALALVGAGVRTVADVLQADDLQYPPRLRPALEAARQCIPAEWRQAFAQAHAPGSTLAGFSVGWYTHAAHPALVFELAQQAGGTPSLVAYPVLLTGALAASMDHVPAMNIRGMLPAAVVQWDASRAGSADASAASPFLMPSTGLLFDPACFALGNRVLPSFVVKEAY